MKNNILYVNKTVLKANLTRTIFSCYCASMNASDSAYFGAKWIRKEKMMRRIESINIYEGLQLGLTVFLWKKQIITLWSTLIGHTNKN